MHFGHANILKHDKRPFSSIEEHDEALIANWHEAVRAQDVIYCLGDITFSSKRDAIVELLGRLNGKIFLVRGNHDRLVDRPGIRERFEAIENLTILKLKGEGIEVPGGKLYVSLCHYAMRRWRSSHRPDSWHLYGHSHGQLEEAANLSFDCGIMLTQWRPAPWEDIVIRMKEKLEAGHGPTDHHLVRET